MTKLFITIPTFSGWEYAMEAISSARKTVPEALIFVCDDGSPDFPGDAALRAAGASMIQRYSTNDRNMTRSWNAGARIASEIGAEYLLCGNSDLLFTEGWWEAMQPALNRYAFAGPITNAPGHVTKQDLRYYCKELPAELPAEDAEQHAENLRKRFADHETGERYWQSLNGFCFVGKTVDFWKFCHSPGHVFDPAVKMEGNEDEFFRRVRNRGSGRQTGIALRSYVYHYRGVSRGLVGPAKGAARKVIRPLRRQHPCEHLSDKVMDRPSSCWKTWIRECELLSLPVSHDNHCQKCESYQKASN